MRSHTQGDTPYKAPRFKSSERAWVYRRVTPRWPSVPVFPKLTYLEDLRYERWMMGDALQMGARDWDYRPHVLKHRAGRLR